MRGNAACWRSELKGGDKGGLGDDMAGSTGWPFVWCLLIFASLTGCGHAGADLSACRARRPILPTGSAGKGHRVNNGPRLRGGGAGAVGPAVAAPEENAVARQIEAAKNASRTAAGVCWSDIWLEHAIARCASDFRPVAPQVSRASPFLPLIVAPGGLEAVTLLERRMLLDQLYKTVPLNDLSCLPSSSLGQGSPKPDNRVKRDVTGARASNPGVMGPDGIMALQVNGWEPLLENVTHDEQRLFVQELTRIAKEDDEGRHKVLLKFSGKLGKMVIEEWESYLLSVMLAVLCREAPDFLAGAEAEEGGTTWAPTGSASAAQLQEEELPEEIALVHSICSSLLNFCEETSARLPPEATQRYMHVEMATMGWETLIALLQSTPVGQKLPASETVPALVPGAGVEYPHCNRVERDSSAFRGEGELVQADGHENDQTSRLGKTVFRNAGAAGAFAVVHQALGDCYWQRRAGERFEYPFTARNLENNLDAALLHYLRAARVHAVLQQKDSDAHLITDTPNLEDRYRMPLAQSYLGAATVLAAKRLPIHWTAIEEMTALSACGTSRFCLSSPAETTTIIGKDGSGSEKVQGTLDAEQESQGRGNVTKSDTAVYDKLEVAIDLLSTAVQMLDEAPNTASSSKAKAAPSPDWVHAQVQLAVCLSRRSLYAAAGERIRLVIER